MKFFISLLILTLSLSGLAQEKEESINVDDLSPEWLATLEEIRSNEFKIEDIEKKKNINKKNWVNDNYEVRRGDNRIIEEIVGVGDTVLIKTCHANPVRISFPADSTDTIFQVAVGNTEFFGITSSDSHPNSKILYLKKQVEGTVQSPIWVFRSSDKRPYTITAIGEPCPDSGILPYPYDITIKDSEVISYTGKRHPLGKERYLIPTDFLAEISQGTTRKNDINNVIPNGVLGGGTSKVTTLSVSIPLTSHVSYPIKSKDKLTHIKEPKFTVINKLMTRVIGAEQTFLRHSSQLETDARQFPTLRFSLSIQIDKKKIIEDERVFLMVLYEDLNVHQMVEINLKELLDEFKNEGGEI